MLIRDLQKRAHATSRTKGWWDGVNGKPSPQCVIEKLCLVHAEVTEAVQECEVDNYSITFDPDDKGRRGLNPNPKPIGLPIELADIAIRTADLADAMGIDLGGTIWKDHPLAMMTTIEDLQYLSRGEQGEITPEVRVLRIHASISHAVEAIRDGREPNLGNVLRRVAMVADSFSFDLTTAIAIKMAYNETRPHRHGKVL